MVLACAAPGATPNGQIAEEATADAAVEQVMTTTLETTPKDATHWSTRSLAAEVGRSQLPLLPGTRRGAATITCGPAPPAFTPG